MRPLWVVVNLESEIKSPLHIPGKCIICEVCTAEHHADSLINTTPELARRVALAEMGNGNAVVCQRVEETADLPGRWLCDVRVLEVVHSRLTNLTKGGCFC